MLIRKLCEQSKQQRNSAVIVVSPTISPPDRPTLRLRPALGCHLNLPDRWAETEDHVLESCLHVISNFIIAGHLRAISLPRIVIPNRK